MAIASLGTLGTGASSSSGTTLDHTTATTALAAGDFAILTIVGDNISSADGDNNEHTSVTGGTGTWTKLGEHCNSNAAAGAGVTVSDWLFEATGTVSVGTVFTANFSSAITAKCSSMWGFSKASGQNIRKDPDAATNPITTDLDATTNFGSAVFSGLPSQERLYFRGLGKESNATTALAPSASFTAISETRSGTLSTSVLVRGEFRINTSTGETSNPTHFPIVDSAGLFLALEEYSPGSDASSAGTSTATATGASTAAATGAADGTGAASATGASDVRATGSVAGAGAAAGVAAADTRAVASAAGTATAVASGASGAASVATSAGVATASAVAATTGSVGTSAGLATATATGASTTSAVAGAAGVATASGMSALSGSVAIASGGATAGAVGASTVSAVAASAAAAATAATGRADISAVGVSAGSASASGTGRATVSAVAVSGGSCIALGLGAGTARAVFFGAGVATVSGSSVQFAPRRAALAADSRSGALIVQPANDITVIPPARGVRIIQG